MTLGVTQTCMSRSASGRKILQQPAQGCFLRWLACSFPWPKSCGFAVLKRVFPPLRRHAEGEKPGSLWPPRKAGLNPSNRSGRIKRAERVSEYLEESPSRLARPPKPQSWDVSRRKGDVQPHGFGCGGHPRTAQKAHKSVAFPCVTMTEPVFGQASGFAPAPTRSTRPYQFKDMPSFTR